MEKTLTPAMEDYLELIIKLKQDNKVVRVRDIAKGMKVKMPSVTAMLNSLAKKNLISHERYEYVDLTASGLKKAREALRKHMIIFNFLNNVLSLDAEQADQDACRMEHAVSPATLKKLVGFIEFFESCQREHADFMKYLQKTIAEKDTCKKGAQKR